MRQERVKARFLPREAPGIRCVGLLNTQHPLPVIHLHSGGTSDSHTPRKASPCPPKAPSLLAFSRSSLLGLLGDPRPPCVGARGEEGLP